MIRIIFLMCFLVAQNEPIDEQEKIDALYIEEEKAEEEKKQKMESMLIWRLTEELDLRVDQADKFFPRFRQHRKIIDDLRNKEKLLGRDLNDRIKAKNLSSSDVEKMIKESTSIRKKIAEREEKFLIESGKILDPNQQAKLGTFKLKMMRDMKGKMKKRDKRKKFRKENRKNKRGYWK